MTDKTEPDDQDTADREILALLGRLVRAAADHRGHSPSRGLAHGKCDHCAATRQAAALIRGMEDEAAEPSRIVLP